MKLSFIIELLLICVLIAFAASAVIGKAEKETLPQKAVPKKHLTKSQKRQQTSGANRFCSCSTKLCNCCREFNIPVVALQGPGCASLQYLKGDRLAVSMSFGERILSNTTISGRRPQPVCMPLPGGVSQFCGRVYNIGRKGDDFKACLGLELRTLEDIEATLRVSCFRFGSDGLRVEAPQPLPVVDEEVNTDDEEDEDDDDDDDYDEFSLDDDDDDDYEEDGDAYNDVEEDYTSFSLLGDDFINDYLGSDASDEGNKKKGTNKRPSATKIQRKPSGGKVRPVENRRKPQKSSPPVRKTQSINKVSAIEETTSNLGTAETATSTNLDKTEQVQDQLSASSQLSNDSYNATTNEQINVTEPQADSKLNATSVDLNPMSNSNNEIATETDAVKPNTAVYTSLEEEINEQNESEIDSDEDSDEDDTDIFSEVVGEIVEDEIEDSTEKLEPKPKIIAPKNKKSQ